MVATIKKENIRRILDNPGHYLYGNVIELVKLVYPEHDYSDTTNRYFRVALYAMIYSFFAFGLFQLVRKRGSDMKIFSMLALAFIVYNYLVITPFNALPRYNTPFLIFYILVGFAGVVLAILYAFLKYSRPGRALRAVVEDFEIASIQGIRARIYYPLGFGLGVGLASVAGALMAPLFSVSPFVGATPLLKAFIVVVLGGLGSIPGAAFAGLVLGLIESYASLFFSSSTADMVIFAVVMVMLVMRPKGLLGKGEI